MRERLLKANAVLLLVLDGHGVAIGAFTSFPWRLPCRQAFGSGHSFVSFSEITARPSGSGDCRCTTWASAPGSEGLMLSRPGSVSFGPCGSDGSAALSIDACLAKATSCQSNAFNNL